jgi:GNAT superfamily N-acetyltransferase
MREPDRLELELRRFEWSDEPGVLELLQASLGWLPDDDHTRFFRWKHMENAFGPSPAWVAVDPCGRGRIVGFRAFLRWEFVLGGGVVRAVRAVDTATHPASQGRGVFARLTLHAIDELRRDGVSFVFNTPNDRSRPGYLMMGWQPVGRLPVLVRPRSVPSLIRLARSRGPAEKWSVPTRAGRPVADVLAGILAARGSIEALVPHGRPDELVTRRSVDYLRWRYGFEPLGYRAVVGPGGVVIFRLRRRGPALEAAVCEELAPASELGGLLRAVLRETGADHAVRLGGGGRPRAGFVPLPGQGPTLVWRTVAPDEAAMPELSSWRLTLGDVELF